MNMNLWYHYLLGNRGINFPLTLVVHILLIVICLCNVLWMRTTNVQTSATMVIIYLKVSVCRDISNITKHMLLTPVILVVLTLTLLSMQFMCIYMWPCTQKPHIMLHIAENTFLASYCSPGTFTTFIAVTNPKLWVLKNATLRDYIFEKRADKIFTVYFTSVHALTQIT